MKLENEDIQAPEAKKIEPPPRHRTRMKKAAPPPPAEPAPQPPLSNGVVLRRSVSAEPRQPQPPKPARNSLHLARPTPGEDCAIDEMLEGRMELTVVLPDLKKVRMTVDRRTPMMDILVQAATSNKICPSEHIIQLAGRDAPLHTPSAPVGALDARTLHIVPKAALDLPVRRMPKLPNQPFEQTFRLQVNLPQNQRMVVRVSPRTTLAEIKQQVCAARELDLRAHHLVHPAQPDTVLDLEATLEVYGCAEITLISSAGLRDSIRNTATYFTQPPRLEEEKRKKGILRLFSRRKRDFTTETPANGVNHLSSSQSDGSTLNRNSYQAKQSTKRKPAPAPPPNHNPSPPLITQSSNSLNSRPESEISVKTVDDIESSVSHSRHSSDSSGYHEPSVFSDCSENKSPEASVVHGDPGYVSDVHRQDSPLQRDHLAENTLLMKRASRDSSNLQSVPSCSNVSISSASRKRKAPQPPVATLPAIESPSSPDAPPVAEPSSYGKTAVAAKDTPGKQDIAVETVREATDCEQQESEALQYLEDVLQESSKELPSPPMLDDSDTDSLRDECQVISVCQAEVHATASDHESPDSLVESQTVVASAPESQTDTSASLPNPNSLPVGSEESTVLEIVPSEQELPADNCRKTENKVEDLESPACEGVHLETKGIESLETEQLLEDVPSTNAREQNTSSSCMTAATVQDTSEQQPADKEASKIDKASSEESSANSVHSGSRQSSTTVTPQLRKKLDNFVLTSFKKDGIEDIFSSPTDSNTNSCLVKSSKVEVPKQIPDVERISTKRAVDVPVISREVYVQPSKTNTLPLSGRCSSMYNLTPQKEMKIFSCEKSEVTELDESMKRTQSVQDVSDVDVKANLMQEQRRLQEEYQRLQQQFISWQKQLMNNQSLLQSENILPPLPFASPAGLDSLENSKKTHSENQLSTKEESSHNEEYKTRSLPRPKSTSFSLRQFRELPRPKTPPVPSSPSEASVVNISIDSEGAKRPDTLTSCSVNTQADVKIEDKVTQVPSPQDKTVQVPSPQEKVTSGVQVPSPPEATKSKENVSAQTSLQNLASPTESTSSESEGSKSQTLPRPKPKPISAFQPSQTMTLNRKSMPKPAVAVTIGSWQQRQSTATADIEPSNVASSRSKFQSLENIPQSSAKTIPAYMEKRKLPPVPTEETSVKEVHSKKLTEQPSEKKGSNVVRESKKPSVKSSDSAVVKEQNAHDETLAKTVASSSKTHHSEGAVPKHKTEVKKAAKEPTTFKSVKPFIKMSSMKDESHSPTIVGLRKWPLSDINENKALGEDRPTVIEDLKASSRRPGGFFVQEKIRRAEVDLRKPKSSKTEPSSAAKMKKAEIEPDTPKPSGTQTTPKCQESEPCVKPSKLHITKVSITSRNSDQPPRQEKRYSSNVTTPVCAPGSANTNTIPKSHSLNSELLAAFSKKSEKDSERYKEVGTKQSIKLNGSVQPPPPPPPPPVQSTSSVMPPIPPAEQIPVSSQLVMAKGPSNATVTKKESKKDLTSFTRTSDPREELMLEIRGFGGKKALKKVQTVQPGWNLKVYGTTTTTNS